MGLGDSFDQIYRAELRIRIEKVPGEITHYQAVNEDILDHKVDEELQSLNSAILKLTWRDIQTCAKLT